MKTKRKYFPIFCLALFILVELEMPECKRHFFNSCYNLLFWNQENDEEQIAPSVDNRMAPNIEIEKGIAFTGTVSPSPEPTDL